MDFIPVLNTVELELIFALDGQIVENTLSFEHSGPVGLTEVQALADVMKDWWNTNMAPRVSQNISLQRIQVTDLTTATSLGYTLPVVPNLPGGVAGDSAPNNVCVCISFRTSGRGRSARGRNYIGAIPEALTTMSRVSLGLTAEYTIAYNAIRTVLPTNWTWVVVSRRVNKANRAAGLTQEVTSALVVDNIVDSQRRRLPGRGK